MNREGLWRVVRDVYGPLVRPYGMRNSTLRDAFDRSYGWRGATYREDFRVRFEAALRPLIIAAMEQRVRELEQAQRIAQTRASYAARAAEMCALRRDGATFRQIADVYGITQERVRQILIKHDATHPSPEAIQRKKDEARFRKRRYEAGRRERLRAPIVMETA